MNILFNYLIKKCNIVMICFKQNVFFFLQLDAIPDTVPHFYSLTVVTSS